MKTITIKIELDEFTEKIAKAFDFVFDGNTFFNLPDFTSPIDYNIGVIVGSSGSGKTQILKNYFDFEEPSIMWHKNKAIISHFKTPEEAIEKMFAVGLSSIPSLCRPFHVLSNGEQFRANIARQLVLNESRTNKPICIDEFTSVVNRETAKSLSTSISKYIRKKEMKKIIFVSCHKDILDWLEPDWVFDCDKNILGMNEVDFSNRKLNATIEIH